MLRQCVISLFKTGYTNITSLNKTPQTLWDERWNSQTRYNISKIIGMPCMYPSVAVTLTCEGYIKVIMYIKTRD